MKDPSIDADERKIADIIRSEMPDLVFRVHEDPRTEECRVIVDREVIHEIKRERFLELDNAVNIRQFLRELKSALKRSMSRKR